MTIGSHAVGNAAVSSDVEFLAETPAFIRSLDSGNALFLLQFTGFSTAPSLSPTATISDAAVSQVAVSGGSSTASGLITHRFGGADYSDGGMVFQHRITGLSIERRADSIIGTASVFAEIDLENVNGDLDPIALSEAVVGREAEILCGPPHAPLSDFSLVARLPVADVLIAENALTVRLEASNRALTKALSDTVYAGTGSLEGTSDLAGVRRPLSFGKPRNVTPVLVDPSLLIYQVHDGAISGLDGVFDEGVALTAGADYTSQTDMLNNPPAAGHYRVWPGGGYFRLGSTPAGVITADVRGVDRLPGDVLDAMLSRAGLINNDRINQNDLAELNTSWPYDSQVFDTDGQSFIDLSRPFTESGALMFIDRWGRMRFRRIDTTRMPVDYFFEEDIIDISVESMPPQYSPAVYRVEAAYGHNYTTQNNVAGGATNARRAFVQAEDRKSIAENAGVLSQYPGAQVLDPQTPFVDKTGGDAVASQLIAFFGAKKTVFRVALPIRAVRVQLFDMIFIQIRRFGLDGGRNGLVIGTALNAAEATVEISVVA